MVDNQGLRRQDWRQVSVLLPNGWLFVFFFFFSLPIIGPSLLLCNVAYALHLT